jgi:Putative stress-responsive transcriptional regulator
MHIPIKRSKNNKIIAGVVGGLAEHFGWNAAVARILFCNIESCTRGARYHCLFSPLVTYGATRN